MQRDKNRGMRQGKKKWKKEKNVVVAMVTREGIDSRAVSAITQRVGEMGCGALRLIALWLKQKIYLIKARWDSTKTGKK